MKSCANTYAPLLMGDVQIETSVICRFCLSFFSFFFKCLQKADFSKNVLSQYKIHHLLIVFYNTGKNQDIKLCCCSGEDCHSLRLSDSSVFTGLNILLPLYVLVLLFLCEIKITKLIVFYSFIMIMVVES